MAKRRIRTLLRQGWTEVTVPRKNLYNYNHPSTTYDQGWGDMAYMKDIVAWCQERFDANDYVYSAPTVYYGGRTDDSFKRFVFRRESDAVMFKLKWSE